MPDRPIVLVQRMLLSDKLRSDPANNKNVYLRVIYVDGQRKHTWLYDTSRSEWPFCVETEALNSQCHPEGGCYTVAMADPWERSIAHEPPGSKAMIIADKRYEAIYPLIHRESVHLLLARKERRKCILKRCKEVSVSRQTMEAWIRLYWQRGMTKAALWPDYENCGTPENGKRNLSGKKLGAPRLLTLGVGINAGASDKTLAALHFAADYWLDNKQASYRQAVNRINEKYFSKEVINDKGMVIGVEIDTENSLTEKQVSYFITNAYSENARRQRKHGKKAYLLRGRALPGTACDHVQAPGDQFQLDATVGNIYLVSVLDRRRIVGRPVVYLIVDVLSGLIVGMHVTYEGPSWAGAAMALINMVTPKVMYCKSYGIDIEEYEWPCHHGPSELLGDKGEMMKTEQGKNIVENLEIEIENAASGRADHKAPVERRFGIIDAIMRDFSPGYVEKDFDERGAKDYRLDAALTLPEFTKMMILAIKSHNHSKTSKKYIPPEMVTDGYRASPLDIWHWGIDNLGGSLRTYSIDEVALNVMESKMARVTPHGIMLFENVYYTSDTAENDAWFDDARKNTWQVKVAYDTSNLANAYVVDSNLANKYERCRLRDRSHMHDGVSQFEYEEVRQNKKHIEAAQQKSEQEVVAHCNILMEKIMNEGIAATKAVQDPEASLAERTGGISSNRAAEIQAMRSHQSLYLDHNNPSQYTFLTDEIDDDAKQISEQRRKQRINELKEKRLKREAASHED